jgi:hypothetical protein
LNTISDGDIASSFLSVSRDSRVIKKKWWLNECLVYLRLRNFKVIIFGVFEEVLLAGWEK